MEAPLTLTLEELYAGGPKRLAINRRIYDAASGSGVRVREEVTINIAPGWQEGQRCAASATVWMHYSLRSLPHPLLALSSLPSNAGSCRPVRAQGLLLTNTL